MAALLIVGAGCALDVGEHEEDASLMSDGEVAAISAPLVQDCSAILADGIYDELSASTNASDAFALAKGFCKELSEKAGGGGDIGFNYGIIGIKLGGSGSSSSWTKYCESYNTASSSAESTSLMTKTVSQSVVDAWSACVTSQGGLACYQKPGQNIIGFTYDEIANSGHLVNTTLTLTNMKVQNAADVKPTLYIGDTGVAYSVTDSTKDATLLLNGRTQLTSYAQSCSVLVKSQSSIRNEIQDVWWDVEDMYLDIYVALNSMSVNSFTKLARDRAMNAALSKFQNAVKKWSDCGDSTKTCSPPLASDYKYSYTLPGVACPADPIKPKTVTHNILTHTGAGEVNTVKAWNDDLFASNTLCVVLYKAYYPPY